MTESCARATFEVFFKCKSLFIILKTTIPVKFHWSFIFCRLTFALIVIFNSFVKSRR